MVYSLTSKKSSQLSGKEIKNICLLKNTHWKYGAKSQLDWLKKNIKKNDIHNLLFIKSKFVGYTLLKKRTCFLNKTKTTYLYFDTLILNKKYKKKKLSNLIMYFNNEIIIQNNKLSFLICLKEMINFYKKFNWKIIKNENISIGDHPFSTYGMIYNNVNVVKGVKYLFYLYK